MANDELHIEITANAAPILDSMEQAASAVKAGASQMVASFGQISTSSDVASSIIEALGPNTAAALIPTAAAMEAAGTAASSMLASFGIADEEVNSVALKFNALQSASELLANKTLEVGQSFAAAGSNINSLLGPLGALGEEESNVAGQSLELDLSFQKAAGSATNLLDSLGQTSEALTRTGEAATIAAANVKETGSDFAVSATQIAELKAGLDKFDASVINSSAELGVLKAQVTQATAAVTEAQAAFRELDLSSTPFTEYAAAQEKLTQTTLTLEAAQQALANSSEIESQAITGITGQFATSNQILSSLSSQFTSSSQISSELAINLIRLGGSAATSATQILGAQAAVSQLNSVLGTAVPTEQELATAQEAVTGALERSSAAVRSATIANAQAGANSDAAVNAMLAYAAATNQLAIAQANLRTITAASAAESGIASTQFTKLGQASAVIAPAVQQSAASINELRLSMQQINAASLDQANYVEGIKSLNPAARSAVSGIEALKTALSDLVSSGMKAVQSSGEGVMVAISGIATSVRGAISSLLGINTELPATASLLDQATAASARLAAQQAALREQLATGGTSMRAYAAAQKEIAVATEEVAAVQAAAESKVSTAQNSLAAATAERKAAQADASTSAGEMISLTQAEAEAEQQLAQVEIELASVKSQSNAVTAESVAASAQAAGTAEAAAAAQQNLTAAVAETAQVQSATSASIAEANIAVDEGVVVNTKLAGAISLLNSQLAIAEATPQAVADAWRVLNTEAQKAGLVLEKTAQGFVLVELTSTKAAVALKNTAGAVSSLESTLAGGAGRMLAYELGAGRLAYVFGTLGRSVGALAPILSAAFAPILLLTFYDVITGMIEKFDGLSEKIRKTGQELNDLSATAIHGADSLELQNLKLEDQIAKIEGRPTNNALKEAMFETKIQVDQLAKSFSDALEKYLELLKAGDVSFFTKIITSSEGTSIVRDKLKKEIEDYKDALSDQQAIQGRIEAATADGNKAKKDSEEAALVSATDTTAKKKSILEKGVADARKAVEEEKRAAINAPVAVFTGAGAATRPATDAEKVQRAQAVNALYRENIQALNTADTILGRQVANEKQLLIAEQERKKAESEKEQVSNAQLVVTRTEPDIKGAENIALAKAASRKAAATEALKVEEEAINSIAQKDIESGKDRVAAESSVSDRRVSAQRTYQTEILAVIDEEYIARKTALDRQNSLNNSTILDETKRVAAHKTITNSLTVLDINYEKDKLAATTDSDVKISAVERSAAEKRYQEILKEDQRLITQTKTTADDVITASSDSLTKQQDSIKAGTDNELRLVQVKEQLHLLTAKQGMESRIALLSQEQQQLDSSIQTQVTALEEEKLKVVQLWEVLSAAGRPADELQKLVVIYNKLSDAIDKASATQEKLKTKIDSVKIDAQIAEWQKYQSAIADFTNQSEGAFNGFVTSIFTSNQRIISNFYQMEIQVVNSFYQMILRMIEQSALITGVQKHFQEAFAAVFSKIGLGPAKAPQMPQAVGAPGVQVPLFGGGQEAASAAKTSAFTTALGPATASLNLLAQAAAKGAASLAEHATTTTTSTAAKTTEIPTIQAATAAKVAETPVTHAVTAAKLSETPVTTAHTAAVAADAGTTHAHTASVLTNMHAFFAHTGAVIHSTLAHIGHGFAVVGSTIAHIGHSIAVGFSTIAHILHIPAILADTTAFIGHAASVLADEIALIVHAIIALFTSGHATGGLIKGAGSGTSDSIVSRLSAGEFVVRQSSVSQPGMLPLLHQINSGGFNPAAAAQVNPKKAETNKKEAFQFKNELMHKAGFAAKGALVPQDMPIFAHANEMILPSNISTGLQKMINVMTTTGSSNTQTTNDFISNTARESFTARSKETARVSGEDTSSGQRGNIEARREMSSSQSNIVDSIRGMSETAKQTLYATTRKLSSSSTSIVSSLLTDNTPSSILGDSKTLTANQLIQAKAGQMVIPAQLAQSVKQAFAVSKKMPFAEKGALLGADQMLFAHKDEMVLPSRISNSFQQLFNSPSLKMITAPHTQLAPTTFNPSTATSYNRGLVINHGGNVDDRKTSNTELHYHAGDIQALDQSGVGDILHRNRSDITKIFHSAVRRGTINPRDILKG